ncbi:type I restriction modification DNA specificity domain protein [Capnocytophaga sp. oral taxon 863 str. F0517]|uniref:restriction endonuclease subunit S n=1 Tax=Capnocytophaga sp. oral taxon 863 TaxID=1227265 RepID=UPI000397961A|nr:restriction endonuclease subunit S [Capnocytophaga sp. oral taxon 863]ERI64694.1 type I restriction modification DNA specificity domain protein [Capnocytophaga sp. oral taxon 863 str. F0517]
MNTKQIRQKILDLAIRGELVRQDSTDEPASVLLERIRTEKEQLIKDKKLKRDKKDNEPIDEVPFELPEGWEWCRLGDIANISMGQSPKGETVMRNSNGIEFHQGKIYFTDKYIDKSPFFTSEPTKITSNSVLLCVRAPVGEVNLVNREVCIGRGLCAIEPLGNISIDFCFFWLILLKDYFNENSTGSTFSSISGEIIRNAFIPLPPLAEQHRIAQKVERLLTIVDTIEQLQEELKALVKQARNQVLNYAIAGKLTHQDPNEEPAEELLKRIGKTTATDTPYEKLPKGWAWCRLGDITKTIATKPYQILQSEIEKNGDFPVISQSANYIEGFSSDETKVLKVEDFIIVFGDHTRVVKYIDFDFIVGADGVKVILPNNNLSKYLYYLILNASYKIENRGYSRHFQLLQKEFFPLPPLQEQHRIVQKIETYFSFLDTIENSL